MFVKSHLLQPTSQWLYLQVDIGGSLKAGTASGSSSDLDIKVEGSVLV